MILKSIVQASILCLLVVCLASCFPERNSDEDGPINGLKPIYMDPAVAKKVEFLSARTLRNPGKIYAYGTLLFINELHTGIHVVNNTDPGNPKNLSFIKIHGNVDIAVKSGILYADNVTDLIALDISNINNIRLVNRIENVFLTSNNFPTQTNVYFECVDPSKGMVVGWEEKVLSEITCRR